MISKNKYLFFFIFSFIFFALAQIFLLIFSNFLVYRNEKIVFFFIPPYLLILILLAIIAFIVFSIIELKKEAPPLKIISLSMILGGGLSNFMDRILRGGVADYFNFIFWKMNLADLFIIVGVILFLLIIIKAGQRAKY